MKQRLIRTLLTTLAFFGLLAPVAMPAVAYAASDAAKNAVCEGLTTSTTGNACDTKANSTTVNETLATVINIFSFVVGFAAIIMIIIGGFRYVISQGDGTNTAGAKNTILYAIIGLVIVAISQILVKFVLHKTS